LFLVVARRDFLHASSLADGTRRGAKTKEGEESKDHCQI